MLTTVLKYRRFLERVFAAARKSGFTNEELAALALISDFTETAGEIDLADHLLQLQLDLDSKETLGWALFNQMRQITLFSRYYSP